MAAVDTTGRNVLTRAVAVTASRCSPSWSNCCRASRPAACVRQSYRPWLSAAAPVPSVTNTDESVTEGTLTR